MPDLGCWRPGSRYHTSR